MIPQNFKDIISNVGDAGLYQTIALLLFLVFFLSVVIYVFSKPKKHYEEQENSPLEDDDSFNL